VPAAWMPGRQAAGGMVGDAEFGQCVTRSMQPPSSSDNAISNPPFRTNLLGIARLRLNRLDVRFGPTLICHETRRNSNGGIGGRVAITGTQFGHTRFRTSPPWVSMLGVGQGRRRRDASAARSYGSGER